MSSSQPAFVPPLDYSDEGPGMIISCGILAFIATVLVVLRFWARRLTRSGLGLDDYLTLSALIAHHGLLGVSIAEVIIGGLGRDIRITSTEDPNSVTFLFKGLLTSEILYGLDSTLIKLAVLALYWRIFPTRSMKIGCTILGSVCIAWTVAIEIVNVVQCRPLHAFWDLELQALPTTKCLDPILFFLGNSIANCVVDFATLTLPIREVLRLQMSRPRKLGICAVFLLGGIAFGASLTRTITTAIMHNQGVTNFTKQFVPSGVTTVIEIYAAISGACLPTLVPVYRKLRHGSVLGSTAGSGPGLTPPGVTNTISKMSNRRKIGTTEEGSFERLSNEESFALTAYHGSQQVNISGLKNGRLTHENTTDTTPHGIMVNQEMTWIENTSSRG